MLCLRPSKKPFSSMAAVRGLNFMVSPNRFTLPAALWKSPAMIPVTNSLNRMAGTTISGSNPKKGMETSSGVRLVPYPIPSVESMYSARNASSIIQIPISQKGKVNIVSIRHLWLIVYIYTILS